MVYQRFIKKDGKISGPYLYKSVRQKDGSVKSIYVGSEKASITLQAFLFFCTILAFFILLMVFRPLITGYFIYSPEAFSKSVNIETNSEMLFDFSIDQPFFQLRSLSIDGSISGDSADVYLQYEGREYLIGSFSGKNNNLIGYAISEFEDIPSSDVSLESENRLNTENPEPITEPLSEEPSEIIPDSEPANLETPVEQTEETIPEQPEVIEEPIVIIPDFTGSTSNSEETVQPIAEPVSLESENRLTTSENASEQTEEPADLDYSFSDSCAETCSMNEIGIGETGFKIKIVPINAKIRITSINYDIVDLKKSFNIDDESLKSLKETGKAKVIVDLKKSTSGMSISDVESNIDIDVKKKFSSSNAVSGEMTKNELRDVIASADIDNIRFDMINTILLSESAPQINAVQTWIKQVDGANITGAGQTVCVVDTGVASHTALQNKVVASHCFCSVSGPCCANGQEEDTTANDDNSHGTHVAGIIASTDSVYRGIAPDSKIVAVKVCDSAGYCSSSDMIAGVEFCVNNSEAYNISVISISIGGGGYSDYCENTIPAMTSAINLAAQKNILVSVASGNNGYTDRITWPACINNATAVMAVDKSDSIASYSNRNSLVDLAAPGGSTSNKITSTMLSNSFGGKYGTSMAAPHASGAAVLLQQYSRLYNNIILSHDKIESILRANGKSINDSSGNYYRIDILSAINSIPKLNILENSIETPGKAKVQFSESTDLSNYNAFSFGDNFIGLDESYSEYDKPARITFYNLLFAKSPVVLKNGTVCNDCSVIDYSNGTLLFNITGFSNYTSSVNAKLSIFSSNSSLRINQEAVIYANYTKTADNQLINGTCMLSINGSEHSMAMNEIYSYNLSFSAFGHYDYAINCTSDDFETLSASDHIDVTKLQPIINFTLNGKTGNATVLLNSLVAINAKLIEPNESIKLYLNNSLINEGNDLSNITLSNEYGTFNVTVFYAESENYSAYAMTKWINVINDTSAPEFSSINGLNQEYSKSGNRISLTINDNVEVQSAIIEHNLLGNFSNYSMSNDGDEYYYDFNVSAGDYACRISANDSSGNVNSTEIMNLTINKSTTSVSLYINNLQQNASIIYGASSNATAYGENVKLYRDDVQVNNSEILTLAAKTAGYAYKANSSGNENYTENSGIIYYLLVNKSEPTVSLTLNGNSGDLSTQTLSIEIRATMSPSGNITLYQNGARLTSGITPLTALRVFNATGTYRINASFAGNENYSAKSKTNTLTITSSTQLTQQQQQQQQVTAAGEQGTSCTPSWTCSEWSACSLEKKTRTCTDLNGCGTNSGKPAETIDCGCAESWKCAEWGPCSNGIKIRTCKDENGCSLDKNEQGLCLLPSMPFLSSIADFGKNFEVVGKTINYLKTDVLPVMKKPVFIGGMAALIMAILATIFRNKIGSFAGQAIKRAKKYKINFRFKIERK